MSLFGKIFNSNVKGRKVKATNEIIIYLDHQCKKSIAIRNQNVDTYSQDNQLFERDQFLYICIKLRKTGETVLKRKLCLFENLGQCLQNQKNQQYRAYLILGYSNQRNTIPKINPVALNESLTFIRVGTVRMSLDSKNNYEQCVLKLHHDYLTYLPSKQKKISFIPLENASVDIVNEKDCTFKIRDKYKGITFKSASKEDMFLWVIAISKSIETRCSEMYMKDLNQKLQKKIKDKLNMYRNRCNNSIKDNRSIFLDEIGRRALRSYFKTNNQSEIDIKMLNLLQIYKDMCKIKREKGEQQSQPIIHTIQNTLNQLREELPPNIKDKNFESKQELIKALQQIMKYLDQKYKKMLIDKKIIQSTFQTQILNQHRQNSRIQVRTLFGNAITYTK